MLTLRSSLLCSLPFPSAYLTSHSHRLGSDLLRLARPTTSSMSTVHEACGLSSLLHSLHSYSGPLPPPPGLSNHAVHHGLLPSPGRPEPPPSRPYHTSAPERETAAVRLGPQPTGGLLTYFSWLRFTSNTTPRLLDHSSWRFPVLTLFFPTNLYNCTRILTAMKASSCLSILLTFPPLVRRDPCGSVSRLAG